MVPLSDLLSRLKFENGGYSRYFPIVLSTLCCQLIGDFCMAYLQVRQRSLTYTAFSLVKLSLGLGLNILFVVFLKLGMMGILYSGLVSSAIVGAALSVRTLWEIGIRFSRSQLRTMFIYGYPLILGAFSNFILTFSSRYFLNHFADLRQVGLYSLGYKLSMLLPVLITGPFISIWSSKRYEIAALPEADEIATKVFTYFAFILIFAATALSLLAETGVRLIATPDFYSAATFVPFVAIGYVCNGFFYHFNYGLYIKNKTKRMALIQGSAAGVNLALNWVLIRALHGIGAALASSLSFMYISVVTLIYSSRLYRLPYEFGRLAKMLIAALATFCIGSLVRFDSLPLALVCKLGALSAYPAALYLLGFYAPSELAQARSLVARLRGSKGNPPRKKRARYRVGLLSTYGNGNLGDAATQQALIGHLRLRRPDLEIVGITVNPEDTFRRHGIRSLPQLLRIPRGPSPVASRNAGPAAPESARRKQRPGIKVALKSLPILAPGLRSLLKAIRFVPACLRETAFHIGNVRKLREFEVLILSGGNQLDDFWAGPWGHAFAVFKWCLAARLAGVRIVLLSVGAGPINTAAGRLLVQAPLRLACYRSYRDEQSRRVVESLRIPGNHAVFPDLAYSLQVKRDPRPRLGRGVLGISPLPYRDPRFWPNGSDLVYSGYIRKLAEFGAWAAREGFALSFFPSQLKMDPIAIRDVRAAMGALGADHAEPRVEQVDDLVAAIRSTDYMLACRYHGILLSLHMHKPVLALSYAPKTDDLMREAGVPDFCYSIETFDLDDLKRGLAGLEKDRDPIAKTLADRAQAFREALDRQYDTCFGPILR